MIPLKYNVRNLIVRWPTTLLTALGFTLIVALLVVMLSFVQGLVALGKRSGPPGNVIFLRDGANDELFSELTIDASLSQLWNPSTNPEIVKDAKGEPLASQEVYSIATQELPPKEPGGRPSYRFLQIRGVEDPEMALKVHNIPLKEGKSFERNGEECIMGEGIARTLGLKRGDVFWPRGKATDPATPKEPSKDEKEKQEDVLRWTVVGIMDSRGSPFDSEIWAKREDVGKYFGKDNVERGQSFYTSVVVQTKDEATADKLVKDAKDRIKQVSFSAMTEKKYYEEMAKSNETFRIAAVFVAGILAFGGMFGLMNTMFATVSQRIKDLGVLRILGYKRWQILLSFLLESLLIGLFGGLLGFGLGSLVHGMEQTGFMSAGAGGGKTVVFEMLIDRTVITYAVAFTLFMGFVGGILPAFTAMRMKPLEAIR